MSEHKAYRCDGLGCETFAAATTPGHAGSMPKTWYELYHEGRYWHFHDATCLRHFAEQLAPTQIETANGV